MELGDREASMERAIETLHWCVTMGHIDILQALLRTHFTNFKLSKMPDQCTNILSAAAQSGSGDALQHLLPYLDDMYLQRTDENLKRNEITKLLCTVVIKGSRDVARVILGMGGDPNAVYHGKPLLYLALTHGHVDIAQILVENGANIHVGDQRGDSILISAICADMRNKDEVIHWLIKNKADPEASGVSGKKPIHMAATHFPSAIVCLAEAGCDVNATDHINKDTPLHTACTRACSLAVYSLIWNGAKMNIVNNMGETPLLKLLRFAKDPHSFHSKSRIKLAQILFKAGFRMNQTHRHLVSRLGTKERRGRDKAADVYKQLQQKCESVSSLLHLCRIRVRESITGIHFYQQLEKLDIPHDLKFYLTFKNDFGVQ